MKEMKKIWIPLSVFASGRCEEGGEGGKGGGERGPM